MRSEDSLISLAMLKVNAEEQHRDYLDYLVPFIREAIATERVEQINDSTVKEALQSDYGLSIPRQTVALCLKRLQYRGDLARGIYGYSRAHELHSAGLAGARAQTAQRLAQLVSQLRDFAKSNYGIAWDSDAAMDAIAAYLSHFGIECLRAYIYRTSLPRIPVERKKAVIFVVSSFIREAQAKSAESFDEIMVLVQGHMLANALLCPDLRAGSKTLSGLSVYLDTPVILRLLKLTGEEAFEAARETINLVKQLDGRVAVFSHTFGEVHSVIRAVATHIEDPRGRGPLVREMRQRGVSSIDLLLLDSRLGSELASLSIVREDTPKYEARFQIDEKVLETALDEDVHYYNPRALLYDINSIRSIYALRAGREPTSLDNSVAVLATTNAKLARVAYQYGLQFESSHEISPVITTFSLANVAWLKQPFAAADLPRVEVMALCYAAIRPADPLWRKYLATADDLKAKGHITPRDHSLLKTSVAVQKELMQLTLGAEENLTDETVSQILERVKKEYATEADLLLQKERAEHARTKQEREAFEAAQMNLIDERNKLDSRFAEISRFVGQAAEIGVFAFFFLAAITASALAGEWGWLRTYLPAKLSVPLLAILLSIFGRALLVTHEVFGWSIRKLARKCGDFVQLKARRLIDRLLYPKQHSGPIISLGLLDEPAQSPLAEQHDTAKQS